MKILIVEDEADLLNSVVEYLGMEGYVCESAKDFRSALDKIETYLYDCILIDINLPDGNGYDLIKTIKQHKANTGVIIVSARAELDDRIRGLDLGADDYITKPFNLSELNARLKSLHRRLSFGGVNEVVAGNIVLLPDEYRVEISKQTADLTRKEFDMLLFFVSNANRIITKEMIAEHLWGDYMDVASSFDFVYTHIKNLRKKLKAYGVSEYIQNVYGLGYKFSIN